MARTKNRGLEEGNCAPPEPRWRPGKYIRLSKEDLNKGREGDSNSVINQEALLDEFCREHMDEFGCAPLPYIDDGFSGTDTDREAFQRLLSDIYAKKINCVMVKDLSRLSRNYTDAGGLIEQLFVRMKVRFISLTEGIDSYRDPDSVSNLLVPITNVINDNFCYQTSKKIRQVFDYKRRRGQFIGAFAAYGYEKDPRDKNALIVDPEAAQVVKVIYAWCLEGMSKNAMVRRLNGHGVPCPSEYKRNKGLSYQNPHGAKSPLWSQKTVGDILKNRLYAGDMVQGRQRVRSYKIHLQEQVPEQEWFVVENTHQPIIERSVFNAVQELLRRDTRTPPRQKELYLFSGFLRCADCGRSMSRSRVGDGVYYFCRTYKDRSKTACTKHAIRHEPLEAAVLYAVQQQLYLGVDWARTLDEVSSVSPKEDQGKELAGLIAAKEREREAVLRYRQGIYQDWKDGAISSDDYHHMRRDYQERMEALDRALSQLRARMEPEASPQCPPLAAFEELKTIPALTREVLIALVRHIRVHEGGGLTICFRFASPPLHFLHTRMGDPPGSESRLEAEAVRGEEGAAGPDSQIF